MAQTVAVLGGGNGGHAAAADLTLRGFTVHMYEDAAFASHMQRVFDTHEIELTGAAGQGTAHIAMVTSNLEEAIEGVKCILVAVPAFAHKAYAQALAGVVQPGQIVLVMPGTFGSLIFWKAFKEAGVHDVIVAETNTLPYATRMVGPGKSLVMSRFNPLKLGVMPTSRTNEAFEALHPLYEALEPVESVIACGLSSLNPLIHVPTCILNAGRIEYVKGDFHPYTEGFTSCVARATDGVDKERIALLKKLGYAWDVAAHGIGGSVQTDNIEEAIAGDPSFAKITGPDSFKNRYYAEDIPFGIVAWTNLADQLGVNTPVMDALVTLGGVIMETDPRAMGRSMEELGIVGMDAEELKTFLENG
ncbi:MAG: NAD/NADP octopine/nopaline dehydrogenase family protein [Eggerthellaceae bacterium]